MLNMVDIEPGYGVHGSGQGMGLVNIGPGFRVDGADLGEVEIEPGYLVDGASLGAYDDVTLVGTGMGAYDDVTLVGALGQDDRPFFKRPMVYGVAAGILAAAAGGYFLGKARG